MAYQGGKIYDIVGRIYDIAGMIFDVSGRIHDIIFYFRTMSLPILDVGSTTRFDSSAVSSGAEEYN